MKRLKDWYLNLNLKRRVIISINATLVVCLSLISVLATINRENTQFRDADTLLSNEMVHLSTILDLSKGKDFSETRELFLRKKFYNTGHASLISREGEVLIDSRREKQNIKSEPWFRQLNIAAGLNMVKHYDAQKKETLYIYYKYYHPLDAYITATVDHTELITKPVFNTLKILLFALVFTLLVFSLVNFLIIGSITRPIHQLVGLVKNLSRGVLPDKSTYCSKNEVGQMACSINDLIDGLKQTAIFAQQIGENNFDHPFKPLCEEDVLGNNLIGMRDNLKKANDEEKVRKEEDNKRNWTTQGLAKFADILRQNHENINELSYNIISNLVAYLEVNQGGVFIMNDENVSGDATLELTACYAYDRRKFLEKKILPGEGLVGTCFLEQETIYLTHVPQDYIRITSGLGDENPGALLIVPLKVNEDIFGVIELASFNPFEKYKIEFIEKIGESIASTIAGVKINSRTKVLLEQSQMQAEQMRAQEEEMRQNMEELSATQEAMAEKERDHLMLIDSLTRENEERLKTISLKEKQLKNILEECPESVFISNSKGDVSLFNKAAEALFGYLAHEIIGKNAHLLINDFQACLSNLGSNQEIVIHLKSGEAKPAILKLTKSYLDNIEVFVGYIKPLLPATPAAPSPIESTPASQELPEDIEEPTETSEPEETEDLPIEDIHKGDLTENQERWAEHLEKSGKKFKKKK